MTLQFKIQIRNLSKPTVWRRVLVPENYTFDDLHQVIQMVFLWSDYHLYMFNPKGYGSHPVIALPNKDDWERPELNAAKTKLSAVFTTAKQTFTYIYDFGDDWIHNIVLEKIVPEKILFPICLDGKGACPPEDCGGPWGYENMKVIMSDPKNDEYDEMKEWLCLEEDEEWDFNFFDVADSNKALAEHFRKTK